MLALLKRHTPLINCLDLVMDDRYTVPALQRGLQILSLFKRDKKEFTGAELAHLLELPRASVFRILQTLEQENFVERVADSTRYRLGVGVLRLGFEYISSLEITEHGRPILDALRDATSYSAHLVVRDGLEAIIVAKSPGFAKLFNSIRIGARLPVHATVLGRVLLSNLSSNEIEALYKDQELKKFTPTTPVSLEHLNQLIASIARSGFGISEGGYEVGISTIAAPVWSQRGDIVAALSISVPNSSIPAHEKENLIAYVKQSATQLTQRLGNSIPAVRQAADLVA
jgi:DNA-binding IclR family transcriptional regulator